MNRPTHELPGRLRLRFTQLKRDPYQLSVVTEAMRNVAGVMSVEESPITGGMLIHYAAGLGASRKFWNDIEVILLAHHLHHDPRPLGRQAPAPASELGRRMVGGVIDGIVDGVSGALVDKLVKRSAVALVAALL